MLVIGVRRNKAGDTENDMFSKYTFFYIILYLQMTPKNVHGKSSILYNSAFIFRQAIKNTDTSAVSPRRLNPLNAIDYYITHS